MSRDQHLTVYITSITSPHPFFSQRCLNSSIETRLATVWCSNPPNLHQTRTKPEVQCAVQLPSRTKPQWQVEVQDKPEPEPKVHLKAEVHLILSSYSTKACKKKKHQEGVEKIIYQDEKKGLDREKKQHAQNT